MQNNVTQLKLTVNGKEVVINCPVETTTIEMKESLFQFMKYIGKIEDSHLEQLQKEQSEKVEEQLLELEQENV